MEKVRVSEFDKMSDRVARQTVRCDRKQQVRAIPSVSDQLTILRIWETTHSRRTVLEATLEERLELT